MSIFGAVVSWKFARCGKRKALMIAAGVTFSGSLLLFIRSQYAMIISRGIIGLGFGVASALAPLFIFEIARAKYIEYGIVIVQVWINIGFLIPLIFRFFLPEFELPDDTNENYGLMINDGRIMWREMYSIIPIISVIQFLGLLLIFKKENPIYVQHVRLRSGSRSSTENKNCLSVNTGINGSLEVQQSFERSETMLEKDTWANLWSISERRKLISCCVIRIFQQLTGVNILQNYALSFFFNTDNLLLNLRFLSFVTSLGFSVFAIVVIRNFGRKTLFLIGFILIGFFNGILFQMTDQLTVEFMRVPIAGSFPNFASFVIIVLFMVTFWLSLSSPPLMYGAELLTDKGIAVVTAVHWSLNAILRILPFVTMEIIDAAAIATRFRTANSIYFFLFSGMSMLGFIGTTLYIKETRGKTREEITEDFDQDMFEFKKKVIFED